MKVELPHIDELMRLGKEDPEKLIKLKDTLFNLILERNNSQNSKIRLIALQNKIDHLINSSNNSLQSTIKLIRLMNSSVNDLNYVYKYGERPTKNNSKVLLFKK